MISNLTNTAVEIQKYSKLYYTLNYKKRSHGFQKCLQGIKRFHERNNNKNIVYEQLEMLCILSSAKI